MMDCKKALEETAGDLEKAVDVLRTKGAAKADKRAGRTGAPGVRGAGGRAEEAREHPRQDRGRDDEEVLRGERPARAEVREGRQADGGRAGQGVVRQDRRKDRRAAVRPVAGRRRLSGDGSATPPRVPAGLAQDLG